MNCGVFYVYYRWISTNYNIKISSKPCIKNSWILNTLPYRASLTNVLWPRVSLRLPWARRCCPFRAHLLNPKLELLKNHKQWNSIAVQPTIPTVFLCIVLRSSSVRAPFNLRSGSVQPPFELRSTSVQPPFELRLSSVWAPFELRSGSVRRSKNDRRMIEEISKNHRRQDGDVSKL